MLQIYHAAFDACSNIIIFEQIVTLKIMIRMVEYRQGVHLSVVVLVMLLVSACSSLSASSTLTAADRTRLQQVLQPGWQLTDLSLVMYAASGYKHLGIAVPDTKVTMPSASDSKPHFIVGQIRLG